MRAFDVQAFMDGRRVGRTHIAILALCTTIMLIDGFDVYMVGKLAPAIAASFGETPAAMTLVFAVQQTGLALGGFLIGPLADRWGRKRLIVWSTLGFGLLTLACLLATNLPQLAVLRGLAGLFLSGIIPTIVALLTEISPRHARARLVTIAFSGLTTGSAAGALVAAWLLDDYGWEIGFWIGGIAPLAILPLILWLLPESIQFRARRDPNDPTIAASLKRFDPELDLTGVTHFDLASEDKAKVSLMELFRSGRALPTVLIWLAFFLALGNVTLLASWMPTYFQTFAGIPIQRFALFSLLFFAGSLAGVLSIGFLMDKLGARRVLPAFYFLNVGAIAAMGLLSFGTGPFVVALFLLGFLQSGGQAGLNAVAATLYPAAIRSTGVGATFGSGRIGGILLPMAGGLALAGTLSLQTVFLLVAIPSLLVGIVMAILLGRWGRQ
ncbi:MAG TPA: MFS transporter [Allosphingosinicella sp.]|nr:MFS transporter [Allosphingosinicella sp.]